MKNSKKPKLKVVLFVDTEADFYYLIPSPNFSRIDMLKWKLNKLRGKLYRYPYPSRLGVQNIIDSCKRHNQKMTLCIVGHLYLKSCSGFPHSNEQKPRHPWYHKKIGQDWYFWDHGGDYKTHPGRYLGDIIEKEKSNSLFDFGLHAFTHEALTLESEETINSLVSAGIKAANSLGIKITSFACPFEMTEDSKDPEKLSRVLKKNGIKTLFQSHLQHSGTSHGESIKKRYSIQKPIVKSGLQKIYLSDYFEGTSTPQHMKKIMSDILKNKDKDAIYCLGTHDFTHKDSKNLDKIILFLKQNGF